jgi:hypothetical protein
MFPVEKILKMTTRKDRTEARRILQNVLRLVFVHVFGLRFDQESIRYSLGRDVVV